MLDKPKFLIGEVKPFEYAYEYVYHIYEGVRFEQTKAFYTQPFKPEMIQEYFEGWKENPKGGYIKSSVRIFFWNEMVVKNYSADEQFQFPVPQTLQHFISDTQRAGITLRWK